MIDIVSNAKLALYLIDNGMITINDVINQEVKNEINKLIKEREVR